MGIQNSCFEHSCSYSVSLRLFTSTFSNSLTASYTSRVEIAFSSYSSKNMTYCSRIAFLTLLISNSMASFVLGRLSKRWTLECLSSSSDYELQESYSFGIADFGFALLEAFFTFIKLSTVLCSPPSDICSSSKLKDSSSSIFS